MESNKLFIYDTSVITRKTYIILYRTIIKTKTVLYREKKHFRSLYAIISRTLPR